MKNVTAILSLLHESPLRNSATRFFREEPVLRWTLRRLARAKKISSVAIVCWEDQLDAVAAEAGSAFVLAKGPRRPLPEVDTVAAARRWSDGWRGGLLGTCDFDLGFYGPWFDELGRKVGSEAVVSIDPSAGLVDPLVLDGLVAHAEANPEAEICFVPAAPGLGGVLLRAKLLERLAAARMHAGRLLHYRPDLHAMEPLATNMCAPVPTPVARTTHRFKLDSDRQIARLSAAMVSLNGHLVASLAEEIVNRSHACDMSDPLPREVVLELNTVRASRPVWWAGSHRAISRPQMSVEMGKRLIDELSALDDTRLTLAGVGDPLLCDSLFEFLYAARAAGTLSIHIETDFLELAPSTLARLAAAPVDVISVHLPAMNARTYAQVMGVSGYDRAVAAMHEFITERRGTGLPILVPTFTKCRQNLAEMEAWYDQWIKAVGCAVVRGPSDCAGQIPDVSVADMSPPRRLACRRLASRISILSDGNIVSCEEDILGKQSLGQLGRDSLQDVWQRKFSSLRADHRGGNWTRHSLCGNCREWHRS